MKKKSIMRILMGTLCLTMMISATAFAGTPVGSDVINDNGSKNEKTECAFFVGEYMSGLNDKGVITSVVKNGDYYAVTIHNDNMGKVFIMDENEFIIDQKSGKNVNVKDLKKDMTIVGILPSNSPETLSLPPQNSSAVAFVIADEKASIDVSLYNDELTNAGNSLKLNISEKTQIIDTKGTKKIYTANDVKNHECVVLYTNTTRSIPAQTSPEMVIILEKAGTNQKEDAASAEVADTKQEKAVESNYVELRTAAEAKGYKIGWSSNKKPITLTKDDMKVEITIGSSDFTFKHKTKDIKPLDKMSKLDMPVMLENGKTMIQSSFIDALE